MEGRKIWLIENVLAAGNKVNGRILVYHAYKYLRHYLISWSADYF